MGDLGAFLKLGFRHIVSVDAADHILFLLVLSVIYRLRDWRALFWVVTAFTVGHSITLAVAVLGWVVLPSDWIEFLIPVTIVATGVGNLIHRDRDAEGSVARHRPVIALLFGLVHGAGFAGYLRTLLVDEVAWPLLGFNLGVELGQVLMLALIALLFGVVEQGIARARRLAGPDGPVFRARVVSVSATVACVASVWAWQRLP